MSAIGPDANKGLWGISHSDMGAFLCNSKVTLRTRIKQDKGLSLILENTINGFILTSRVKAIHKGQDNPWFLTFHHSVTLPQHLSLHLSPQAVSDAHPGQRQGIACGEIHTSTNHRMHTTNTHSHRATPATYLCYITHATAYPSTIRSAMHPAKNGDSSPGLVHCWSLNSWLANLSAWRIMTDTRTDPLGCWC